MNQGDKLTKEEKEALCRINHAKYGLSNEYIDQLTLPKPSKVRVYDINSILKSRKKMSISEQIDLFKDIKENLDKKLKILAKGREIKEFTYLTPT